VVGPLLAEDTAAMEGRKTQEKRVHLPTWGPATTTHSAAVEKGMGWMDECGFGPAQAKRRLYQWNPLPRAHFPPFPPGLINEHHLYSSSHSPHPFIGKCFHF
jgi:hypothetical protein